MSLDMILRTALTGGAAGALDAWPVSDCSTGKPAITCVPGVGVYFHLYSATEAGAESSPTRIIPNDNLTGVGAWKLANILYGSLSTSANIVTTGSVTAPTGVYIGGSAAANKIASKTEGSYTATITPATSGSVTLSSATVYYTKIGRQVWLSGYLAIGSIASPVGTLRVSLPFPASAVSVGPVLFSNVNIGGKTSLCLLPWAGQSYATLRVSKDVTAWADLAGSALTGAGTEALSFSLSYITSA